MLEKALPGVLKAALALSKDPLVFDTAHLAYVAAKYRMQSAYGAQILLEVLQAAVDKVKHAAAHHGYLINHHHLQSSPQHLFARQLWLGDAVISGEALVWYNVQAAVNCASFDEVGSPSCWCQLHDLGQVRLLARNPVEPDLSTADTT